MWTPSADAIATSVPIDGLVFPRSTRLSIRAQAGAVGERLKRQVALDPELADPIADLRDRCVCVDDGVDVLVLYGRFRGHVLINPSVTPLANHTTRPQVSRVGQLRGATLRVDDGLAVGRQLVGFVDHFLLIKVVDLVNEVADHVLRHVDVLGDHVTLAGRSRRRCSTPPHRGSRIGIRRLPAEPG